MHWAASSLEVPVAFKSTLRVDAVTHIQSPGAAPRCFVSQATTLTFNFHFQCTSFASNSHVVSVSAVTLAVVAAWAFFHSLALALVSAQVAPLAPKALWRSQPWSSTPSSHHVCATPLSADQPALCVN